MTMETYLLSKGLKIWEKGEHKRIYINDLTVVGIENYTPNPKKYRKVSMYFDCKTELFTMENVTSSAKNTMNNLLAGLRSEVEELTALEEAEKESIQEAEEQIVSETNVVETVASTDKKLILTQCSANKERGTVCTTPHNLSLLCSKICLNRNSKDG